MIEPPLDHVSHTLPERRSDLSLALNPIETDDTDHVLGNDEDDSNVSADSDGTDCSGDDEYGDTDVSGDGDGSEPGD
ncbi:hypothetical protein LA080_015751 [Diaporthe eres]|nr:hypothetical protein LA080_015751 [Diaporthe eres]